MSIYDLRSLRVDRGTIFVVALSVRLVDWFFRGTRVIGDATDALEFCSMASISTLVSWKHTMLYSGFQFPYCGYLYLTDGLVDGWVLFQIVLSAISCVLLYETGRLLVNRNAGLVAGLSFALVWEVFHWNVRPVSEAFFTTVAVIVLWRLAVYETNKTTRNRTLAILTLVWLAITRPNGLAVLAGYLMWDTLFESEKLRLDLFPERRINLLAIPILGVLAVYRLFNVAGFGGISMMQRFVKGVVVTGHVSYSYTPVMTAGPVSFAVSNAPHILAIVVLRALWFFAPVLPGWSTPHIVVALLTLFPLIVGGVVGSYLVARNETTLFKHWVTPIIVTLVTVMIVWVPGSRNYLGIAVASYSLLTGYILSEIANRFDSRILVFIFGRSTTGA